MKPTIDFPRRLALLLLASGTGALAAGGPGPTPGGPVAGEGALKEAEIHDTAADIATPRAQASPQMQAVLDELTALGGKPITELSPADARK